MKLRHGSVAQGGRQRQDLGLRQHEGLEQGLFAGDEKIEEGVTAAGASRTRTVGGGTCDRGPAGEDGEQFVERPIQQVNQRVRVREGRVGAFDPQKIVPPPADRRASGTQCFNQ